MDKGAFASRLEERRATVRLGLKLVKGAHCRQALVISRACISRAGGRAGGCHGHAYHGRAGGRAGGCHGHAYHGRAGGRAGGCHGHAYHGRAGGRAGVTGMHITGMHGGCITLKSCDVFKKFKV